jgi:hypothetical protein
MAKCSCNWRQLLGFEQITALPPFRSADHETPVDKASFSAITKSFAAAQRFA